LKYNITHQDLEKRSYGMSFKSYNDDFLNYVNLQKKHKNPILSHANISLIEQKTLKSINQSIVLFSVFGLLAISYGVFVFINYQPRLAVNLYTQFPYIDNGSVTIVLGLACLIGSFISYIKRDAVLISKVKTKLIEDLKKEKNHYKPSIVSKKQKRFRQKFKHHKKSKR